MGGHSQYSFRSSLWFLHINEITEGDLEALEAKYKTEKIGMNKFIIQKYFDYKMLDNVSVLDQVHELQILVNKLRDLSINMELLLLGALQ